MSETETGGLGSGPARAGIAVCAVLLGMGAWFGSRSPVDDAGQSVSQATAVATEAGESAPAAPAVAPASEYDLESGGTLVLDPASLEAGEPLRLDLGLGHESASGDPRPVRVIGPDGRHWSLEAPLLEGRGGIHLELDPAWLTPGRTIIEVRTTERTHFPLRRYAIEVRGTEASPDA